MADAGKDEPEPEFNPLGRKNSTLHPCCLESFFVSIILVKTISDILFSSRCGKFWPKGFKIGLFLKQKYEIFREILRIFEMFRISWGYLDIILRISGKIFRRFYVILV